MPEPCFVVIHRPGPTWQRGVPTFEQDGLQDHVNHYRQWKDSGQLAWGGPFLDEAGGGMMVTVPGLQFDDVSAFAAADPCVASGLLVYDVRVWMVAMRNG